MIACAFKCKGRDRCANEDECRGRSEAAAEGRKLGEKIGKKLARTITEILDEAGVPRAGRQSNVEKR